MSLTAGRRGRTVRDLCRVHRLEFPFPVAYLCHALWGACFAAGAPRQLVQPAVLLAVLANLIPLIAQNVLNAAMDISADARTPGKTGVARAARRIGRTRLIVIASAEMAVALLLAVGVSLHLGRPLVAAAVAAGILVEYLYNLEPVRLKKRGLANPVSLGLHFSLLPCLSTFAAVRPGLPGWVWPLFLGLWLLLIGRTLWWSLPDAAADRAAGLAPPAVRHGVSRALTLATGATATALGLIAWGLSWALGPLSAAIGTAACGVFLIGKLRLRLTGAALDALHETRMRRHTLAYVVGADALLVLLPLV
ncbi:UbiA family prenyltransferase [Streptomyces yaizuensis]|uniref:UbiA family prenyltransferase n=1 Tax=Streptomyces yaizuensis TaxID=2989713 RepID=A0ABQ5NXE8_9ACTN|nr:UbiA family prenyltransferase [Streptomyces sp. YSPA8]GLF95043.1 UbiA family prenyltransferase [Streptomyces sp. YSPA8]